LAPPADPIAWPELSERPEGLRLGRAAVASLLERHGVLVSRALGQNFLTDPNVAERIVRLAGVGPADKVIEIGAGVGSLTLALARAGAQVVAIEVDRHLLPALAEVLAGTEVKVVAADAMSFDWQSVLGGDERWVLVANLPYNIATPLVLDLLGSAVQIEKMVVMVQREVADRLAASPGDAAYGAVSARLSYFARARRLMRVPPNVFMPRPRVESAVVEIVRRDEPAVPLHVASYGELDALLARAFGVRRKMLRRSLAGVVSDGAFAAAAIDSARRPETLTLPEWGRLAAAVRAAPAPSGSGP
jgi:16S rRNA (adenine1518-N6/adenine1519-N6)-dimethyltransferase